MTAFLHGMEIHHGRCSEGVFVQRSHVHTGKESQRTFRPYDGVGNDVEGVVVCYKRPEVEACYVFDGVFIPYTFSQGLVGPYLIAQIFYLLDEFRMRLPKALAAFFIASVEQCAVGKYRSEE